MIELFTAETPNGKKISIMLEEINFEYKVTKIDIFKNETTELANLILPTTAFGEKEGTITNMEMRVMKQNKILPDPGSTLSEWEYLVMIAKSLGEDMNYENVSEINNELVSQYKTTVNLPTFDNLNKPSNLFGILHEKEINLTNSKIALTKFLKNKNFNKSDLKIGPYF